MEKDSAPHTRYRGNGQTEVNLGATVLKNALTDDIRNGYGDRVIADPVSAEATPYLPTVHPTNIEGDNSGTVDDTVG